MLRVETLGGLTVYRDHSELTSLPGKPLRAAMLVYLAVERAASRETICAMLWPESPPERARHALSQMLFELRRELGTDWVDSTGDGLAMTDFVEVDVHPLLEAASEERFEDVIDSYGGPFLDGVHLGGGVDFERWAEGNRSLIHREVRRAFHVLSRRASDPETRVGLAQSWVSMDPLDDEAQHTLIEALAKAGRRNAALEQYQAYERLIEADLEVEPLDHTKALVQEILAGGARSAASSQESTTPRPHQPDPGNVDRAVSLFPDLKVVRLIGRGTTGSVYLAREPALRRLVAVKVLSPPLADHARARARFEQEMVLAARVLHPNVATVYRVGSTADGVPYFVMPYVKGVTLAELLKAHGPFPPEEVARFLAEAAAALAAAHDAGVIHRDVRPANVLYEERTGRIYLADFGVAGALESADDRTAHLTRTGELLGNPGYVSPEQGRGEKLTDRSDVFSLGVMGWELLSGKPVAAGQVPAGVHGARELTAVLRRATSREPHHRPSAAQVAEALSSHQLLPRPGPGLVHRVLRRRLLPIVGAYAAFGLATMGVVDQMVQQELLPRGAYVVTLVSFFGGLSVAVVLAWFHGEKGRQRVSRLEVGLLAGVLLAWLIAAVWIFG